MKHILKNYFSLLLLAVATLFAACEEDAHIKEYVYPVPVVTSISPTTGYAGTEVTIFGTDFGSRIEPMKVFFGGIPAVEILSCKNNRVVVKVPEKALSGDMSMQLWQHKLENIGQFTLIPTPKIISIASNNAEYGENVAAQGDLVTIKGTGFGKDASAIAVEFNGTLVTEGIDLIPAGENEEEDVVTVTAPEYTSGIIAISVNGYRVEGTALMNPNSPGDVTMFYLKNYKQPFMAVEEVASGDWRVPAEWEVNDQAKSVSGTNHTVGGLHVGPNNRDGLLVMQAGWGCDAVTNGQMLQHASLPAGDYRIELNVTEVTGSSNVYFLVATGDALPTIDGPSATPDSSTPAYKLGTAGLQSFKFTLDAGTEITIGFAGYLRANSCIKVSGIKIIRE